MNRRQKTGIEVGADHIYYNIAVQNDQTTPINLQFQDIRTVELVKNPEEYYLSVVRFFVPGAGIPLFHIDPVTVVVNITSGNPVITSANLFNPLMVGFTAEYKSGEITPDKNEIEAAGFYSADELPGRPSTSFSIASQMIEDFCQKS